MRELSGKPKTLVRFLSLAFSLLYIYTSGFGLISSQLHLGAFLLFVMVLCFLLYPSKWYPQASITLFDWLLCLLAVMAIGYWIIAYPQYAYRAGNANIYDLIMGAILIFLSFVVALRVLGYPLPLLSLACILYALFGRYMPDAVAHPGFSVPRIVEFLACGVGGIYGIVTSTYATFVFPFIIFASFLQVAGAGDAIEKLALAIAGSSRGGPAKVAVCSSAVIGSITGSSIANVVATGAYSIPLMIRSGYKAHVAAGIEAAASSGSQMLPPVMGAAVFLLAAFTETAYLDIIKIAIIPALLYFLGVGMMVHFTACREGLEGLPKEELPQLKTVVKEKGYLLLPIVVLIAMLVCRFSPHISAFYAIISTIVVSYLRKSSRLSVADILKALELSAKNVLVVGATAGVVGIVVGSTTLTGLGIKFSAVILSLSMGFLPLTILLVAVASFILGMGLTVTASYVIVSVLAVPALLELGVALIPAHLTVFWFVETAQITPPVALAAFAASGIAGCDPNKAGFAALRFASPLFLMPFLFIYTPLLLAGEPSEVIRTIATCALGIIAYSGMMQGFWLFSLNKYQRFLMGGTALLLFFPDVYTDIMGTALLVLFTIVNKFAQLKRANKQPAFECSSK